MNLKEFELPIETQDLPNNRLGNIDKEWKLQRDQDPKKIAFDFLKELNTLFKQKKNIDQSALYKLYDYKFNMISEKIFQNEKWPEPEELENQFEDEFELNTQNLYKELCFRHYFQRIQSKDINVNALVLQESWENYKQIFEVVCPSQEQASSQIEDIILPSAWIFDIVDEFIYQNTLAHKLKKQDGEQNKLDQIISNGFWNIEEVEQILDRIIKRSQIIQNKDNVLKIVVQRKKPILSAFALYSIIGLIRINVYKNKFQEALQLLSYIDIDALKEISKAVASYLTLFYYSGYCYLMCRRYREAVKIFEIIINFFYKYQNLLKKSFQYDNMDRQAEKCLCLFTISVYFKPININEIISQKMKEIQLRRTNYQQSQQNQQQQDKIWDFYQRVHKYDNQAFTDLLYQGTRQMQLLDSNQQNSSHLLNKDFEEYKGQMEIISILKLYSQLRITKLASFLNMTETQIRNQIENYLQLNSSKLSPNNAFEQSIISRMFNDPVILEVVIDKDLISVNELQTKKDYKTIYLKNEEACRQIIDGLNTLKKDL